MIQAVQVFSEASRTCKTTKEPDKRKRIETSDTKSDLTWDFLINSSSKEQLLCYNFGDSWRCIKEEFYLSVQKHKEQVIQSIYSVLKETFADFSLPVVVLLGDSTENIQPHLVQQAVDYSQKVDPNMYHVVIKLRSTDFQSLSQAVRAVVEQCISKELFKDYLLELPQDHFVEMDPDSVGSPADFLLQWYHEVCSSRNPFNIIVLIEDIYPISDSILTKFIQWMSTLRNQQVKFCLITFANDDLSLFQAKVESQSRVSIALHPIYDSTSKDAFIQVLENIFVFNVPPFEISSQVLSFLRKKVIWDNISANEFLRLLKLTLFDFFSSTPLKSVKENECSLNPQQTSNVFQDKLLQSILQKHGIKSFEEFKAHMQSILNDRNIAHGVLQWISKDVVTTCLINVPPLDLYDAAVKGSLNREKSLENIKNALLTQIPPLQLSDTLSKWWSKLEPYLEDTEWGKEIEDSFSRLILTSKEEISDNTEKKESTLESESCAKRNWNAAKRRKAMLETLRKRPNRDTDEVCSDLLHLLQKLVNFIDQTFSNPLAQLFTYSSLTHLLQISGYNSLCRKQWLPRNKDDYEYSKYRECILCSLPKGKKRIWPTEWFESSLQLWIERNDCTDQLRSKRDKLWTEFWKVMMELHYCGVIHILQKSQLFIERAIFD
ncbi:hypothetical protein GpartN1_g3338.t1 [Galdieria partita]|uniref:Origin recognition complex subunit 3 N-terminal domain-containing protein n=1 Tax=Galdieria partita TaxID=83374 RepID=A0A9C7PXZ7_9RHOD|nr:hypothetical protein GpartN1_g3338.t1 [Galdieria partita]